MCNTSQSSKQLNSQSANQCINKSSSHQSINLTTITNQPSKQPANGTSNQQVNHPTCQLDSHPTNQVTNLSTNESISQPVSHSSNQPTRSQVVTVTQIITKGSRQQQCRQSSTPVHVTHIQPAYQSQANQRNNQPVKSSKQKIKHKQVI